MNNLNVRLEEIETLLGNAAFLVSKGGAEREAHAAILKAIAQVIELKHKTSQTHTSERGDLASEINKVQSRLRKWAARPYQKNARILRAYLDLQLHGHTRITEEQLKAAVPKDASFDKNFPQMKNIADKNHGKVFDHQGEVINIWEPVAPYVAEFEKSTTSLRP